MCFGDAPDYTAAGEQQALGADEAARIQHEMYRQARSDVAPWRRSGRAADEQLGGLYGLPGYTAVDPTEMLEKFPGFQWGYGRGLDALDRMAASRGQALSGPQRRAATQWGYDYGMANAWNPYIQQLNAMSGRGLQAGGLSGNWAMQTGQMMGNDAMAAANARAQAAIQQAMANSQSGSGWMQGLGMMGSMFGQGMQQFGQGMGGFGGGGGGGFGGMGGGGGSPQFDIGNTTGGFANFGGAAGGFGGFGGGDFAGFMADGGYAFPQDRPYVVGENGPELFMPDRSGFVIPNYAMNPNLYTVSYMPMAMSNDPSKFGDSESLMGRVGLDIADVRKPTQEGQVGGAIGKEVGGLIGSIWGPIGKMAGRHGGRVSGEHIGNILGGRDWREEAMMQFVFDPIKDAINPSNAFR